MKKLFSFFKKFSVITLVLIMTLAPIQTVAFGAQAEESITIINGYVQNPIYYSDMNQSSSLKDFEAKLGAEAYPLIEPALAVKKNLVARNERFTVNITTTRKDFNALVSEIFKLAVCEELATNSNEGDYLAWQYGGYSFSGSAKNVNGAYECSFDFKVPYYTTVKQETQVTNAIDKAFDELDIENLTDHDKVKAIYDYVCSVCNYDYSNTNDFTKFTAYAAIIKGQAVCQGYSTLLYRMLKEAGFNNRIVTSSDHSWNIVELGGFYYNVDATWDDNYFDKGRDYRYFLRCDEHFEEHDRAAQYNTTEFLNNHKFANECYYETYPEDFRSIEIALIANDPIEEPVANVPVAQNEQVQPATNVQPPAIEIPKEQKSNESVCPVVHNYTMVSCTYSTCTQDGYQHHVCTKCGAETTVTVPAKGHRIVIDQAVPATYANDGLTQGSHCADCNLVTVPQNRVPKLTLKATTIKKVKAEKKGFTVEWQKQNDATGYEVQYSTTNKFAAKNTKTATINKNGTVNKKIANLKGNTKYFIRVRAYKVVNGKKYYSSWTTVKNVKTKK